MVVENANEGSDTVYATANYRLGANVEYLVLQGGAVQGYGNALSNAIYGTGADNLLDGDAGADSMYGGAGNDAYFLDNIGDVVVENANEGSDTVYATANYRLGANVENLVLLGGAVQGYGNALSNAIYGTSADNLLDGDSGADAMYGLAGNDSYFVDNAGDFVIENLNEGSDLVYSTVSYTLAANTENLVLLGSGDLNGTGNALVERHLRQHRRQHAQRRCGGRLSPGQCRQRHLRVQRGASQRRHGRGLRRQRRGGGRFAAVPRLRHRGAGRHIHPGWRDQPVAIHSGLDAARDHHIQQRCSH